MCISRTNIGDFTNIFNIFGEWPRIPSVCSTINPWGFSKEKQGGMCPLWIKDGNGRSSTIPLQWWKPMPWKLYGLGDALACVCVCVQKCGRDFCWEAKEPNKVNQDMFWMFRLPRVFWHTGINLSHHCADALNPASAILIWYCCSS